MATQEEIDAYPDELILKPKRPIEVNGIEPVHELVLREPTAAQLREILKKGGGVESTLAAVSITAGVLPAVADKLTSRELTRAEVFFERFLERPHPTGSTS